MESSNAFLGPDPVPEQKSRAKACTECRQVKLKCDFKERAPQPCSRCARRGLDCHKDASFKRVSARARRTTASVSPGTRESSQPPPPLSAGPSRTGAAGSSSFSHPSTRHASITHLSISSPSSSSYSQQASSAGDISFFSTSQQIYPPSDGSQQPRFFQLQSSAEGESWTIGDIVLQPQTVIAIFQHFDDCLWEHVPFVEPCYSLSTLYTDNALLFWTIIAVSCRMHPNCVELYEKLAFQYESHLYPQLFLGSPSVKKVHAILLLCQWPFPVSSQENDPSFNLCGAGINTAMTLDLHKTSQPLEYFEPTPRVETASVTRRMTWMACFQLGTSMSSFFGLPPPISATSSLEAIGELCQNEDIPRPFRAKVSIQYRVARFIKTQDSGFDCNFSSSLFQLLEQDLRQTRSDFADIWDPDLETDVLFTSLYLHGVSFVPSPDPTSTVASAALVLQHGLQICIAIVNNTAQFGSGSANQTSNSPSFGPSFTTATTPPPNSILLHIAAYLRFSPRPFFRNIVFTAYFLLFYISTPLPPSTAPLPLPKSTSPIASTPIPTSTSAAAPAPSLAADRDTAKSYLASIVRLMMAFPNAEHVRVGKSIDIKSRYAERATGKTPLMFTSRLGGRVLAAFEDVGAVLREAAEASNPDIAPGVGKSANIHGGASGASTVLRGMGREGDGMMHMAGGLEGMGGGVGWPAGDEAMQALRGVEEGMGAFGFGMEAELEMPQGFPQSGIGWDMDGDSWSSMGYQGGGGMG